MDPQADPASVERRLHPRQAASESVTVVDSGGHVHAAKLVDRSFRGLRLRLEDAASLIGEVRVLSRASGSVHVARIVWRTPPYAGLSISRTVEMRTATGPGTEAFRRLWRDHVQS